MPGRSRNIPRGWLCPRCGTVWAPDVDHCECGPEAFEDTEDDDSTNPTIDNRGTNPEIYTMTAQDCVATAIGYDPALELDLPAQPALHNILDLPNRLGAIRHVRRGRR